MSQSAQFIELDNLAVRVAGIQRQLEDERHFVDQAVTDLSTLHLNT